MVRGETGPATLTAHKKTKYNSTDVEMPQGGCVVNRDGGMNSYHLPKPGGSVSATRADTIGWINVVRLSVLGWPRVTGDFAAIRAGIIASMGGWCGGIDAVTALLSLQA